VFFGVGDHFGTAGELLAEFGVAPWGDDLDVRRERGGGKLEADLVVAFAGGAVGDGVGTFLEGDVDHPLGDAGAGDRGAEQVAAFVDGVGLEHREDVVAGELFLLVVDVALRRAGAEGFGFEAVEFVALSAVGAVGDDLSVVFFLEPKEEDGGIEPSGIGDDDFHVGRGVDSEVPGAK